MISELEFLEKIKGVLKHSDKSSTLIEERIKELKKREEDG